jgi:4'-phosphopantetheinyl transferase
VSGVLRGAGELPDLEKVMPHSPARLALHRKDLTTEAVFAWAHITEYAALHHTCTHILHPNELAQYERFAVPRRKTSFLLGRYVAKQALAVLLREPVYANIEIAPGVFTQPIVKFPTPEPVGVSITHAGELACALAFPQIHPMAIDVEQLDAKSLEAMKSQILTEELSPEALPQVSELVRCTIIWTAKEALSKVLKCGMMCPFSILETVELRQDAAGYVGYFRNFGQYKFHTWVLNDHVMTIVLPKWTTMVIDLTPL